MRKQITETFAQHPNLWAHTFRVRNSNHGGYSIATSACVSEYDLMGVKMAAQRLCEPEFEPIVCRTDDI